MTKEEREHEKIIYARTMFWGDGGSQGLIQELLDKIYALEDDVKKLTIPFVSTSVNCEHLDRNGIIGNNGIDIYCDKCKEKL